MSPSFASALIISAIGILFLAILIPLRIKEEKGEDNHALQLLHNVVEDTANEIKKVLKAYPQLPNTTIIDGLNEDRPFEMGNIYGPHGNITFPIKTPPKPGGHYLPALFSPRVLIEGTIGDYTIHATAHNRNGAHVKASYSSRADVVESAFITPEKKLNRR